MSILSVKTYESTTLIFINLLCFHHFCAISREKPFVFKDFISILGHSFFRALRRIWQPLAARTALRAQKLRKTNVFLINLTLLCLRAIFAAIRSISGPWLPEGCSEPAASAAQPSLMGGSGSSQAPGHGDGKANNFCFDFWVQKRLFKMVWLNFVFDIVFPNLWFKLVFRTLAPNQLVSPLRVVR